MKTTTVRKLSLSHGVFYTLCIRQMVDHVDYYSIASACEIVANDDRASVKGIERLQNNCNLLCSIGMNSLSVSGRAIPNAKELCVVLDGLILGTIGATMLSDLPINYDLSKFW